MECSNLANPCSNLLAIANIIGTPFNHTVISIYKQLPVQNRPAPSKNF